MNKNTQKTLWVFLRFLFYGSSGISKFLTQKLSLRWVLKKIGFVFSLPPGTKMFQFPGFSSYTYVFSARYSVFNRVGYPIRISPGQRLLTTSPKRFVGSHVLHRHLMSRHPPSTLCALMLMLINICRTSFLVHFVVVRLRYCITRGSRHPLQWQSHMEPSPLARDLAIPHGRPELPACLKVLHRNFFLLESFDVCVCACPSKAQLVAEKCFSCSKRPRSQYPTRNIAKEGLRQCSGRPLRRSISSFVSRCLTERLAER